MPFKSEKQRKWMHKSLPKLASSWEKRYEGGGQLDGMLKGPSHENGGIKFTVGGEVQEAEGGEFVIRKNSVNKNTQAVLEHINKTGDVPKYQCGGHVTDARKRRK